MLADPLFIDPYAAVLLSHDVAHRHMDHLVSHAVACQDQYRLTTRYIDDKLQNLISSSEDIRQDLEQKYHEIVSCFILLWSSLIYKRA